ncbi:3-dehydroquinate synthase [Flavobacterium humi]|uniref:3-dehydroquinate synthase n=1 Tax=Flavobacterium humi TaxID=2562683 RepID=A0A4Z0LD85_9FLAO|nr:3-dehydroquinate synthase [Flavobacterium humi]TGD59841.1 3-dehydroquinate synthase [Flavobacterium humi]
MVPIVSNGYSIYFNQEGYVSLNAYLKENTFSKIFILVDENSNEFCLQNLLPQLETETVIEIIELEPGEENKTIETCVQVWNVLIELGADRKSLMINLGGGVITDLGGFVASTYKRGIPFINIPTTLLSMVDASVGGKNGVDLGGLKNQIGTITNPAMVLVDSDYIDSLPQNQMRSGLAEMLKHGLIAKKTHWEKFRQMEHIDFADFDDLIRESVEIKSNIVTQDPTENGIRKALNFGHTLGHAIETYFLENPDKTSLLHGEAIAAGMIMESFISWEQNLISEGEFNEIKSVLNGIFDRIDIDESEENRITELLIHDKKNEYGKVQFALLNGIGNIKVNQIVENESINRAFSNYKS